MASSSRNDAATRAIESDLIDAEDKLERVINFLPLGELSAESSVDVGAPIEPLVEETRRDDVDLVIMATHGCTGLREALLGSIAEQMVRRAACPVLIVPSHSARRCDPPLQPHWSDPSHAGH